MSNYANKVPFRRASIRDMEATNNHIARMQTIRKNPETDRTASSNTVRRDSSTIKSYASTASTSRANLESREKRSGLNKYKITGQNRASNNNQGRAFMNLAPSDQFRKYLDDDTNVFYEDSQFFKQLHRVQAARFYLSAFLIIIGLIYFIVGRIIPFPPSECPRNANCKVFIHCHSGYVKVGEKCEIDPEIVNKAKKICDAIVAQLSYNLGNSECSSQSFPNSMKIYEVFQEFNVEEDLLKNEIENYFQNSAYQQEKNFIYEYNKITALVKKHSLVCELQLYYQSPAFNYFFISTIISIFVLIWAVRTYQFSKNIRNIYAALKERVIREKIIRIDDQKPKLEKMFGKWNTDIWMAIDRCRYEDGLIVYFVDNEDVFWKTIA